MPSSGEADSAHLKAILGPTNTGKTHYAIERLLAHRTGMIGLPLRLLAREVYQRVVAASSETEVALITGEERIVPAGARYWIATVEAMPRNLPVEFVAIDEIQTATDLDRGHVFTQMILGMRGSRETLLLGAQTMHRVIRALLPGIQIIERPRLSALFYAGSKKITRVPPRTAIIAFSAQEVYAIAELVRRERGGAAIVMGALSPRTRNAQVQMYQNGDVDILVATDAIGMGLNLDIRHVAFSADTKFDGRQTRPLTPAEMAQIAGRAGRFTSDGTFGVTGHAAPLDDEMIERLQTHDFAPVRLLQWRNHVLDFSSARALLASLNVVPDHPRLGRVPLNVDQRTLERLIAENVIGPSAPRPHVELAWQCCQLPDYRNISPAEHARIVAHVFDDLLHHGTIGQDWFRRQVGFCENMNGDIDTLSNRIRQIRTWTFLANKKNWLDEQKYWQHKTRDVENRLSDALHAQLMRRFVDKRTSILIRHLRDKRMTTPQISPDGDVTIEDHLIGTIEGFRFRLTGNDGQTDNKSTTAAAAAAIAPEILNRARRLVATPNDKIVLTSDGFLRWKGEIIAELAEGDDLFSPAVIVLADECLTGTELEQVQDRLRQWLRHAINTQMQQVLALRDPEGLEGTARGIAFQLSENLGILPRQKVAAQVRELDQDVRAKMRRLGIRFGAFHIYLPLSLKPAPRELALTLFALKNGGLRQPGVSDIPAIVLSGRTSFEMDPEVNPALYEVAGFKTAGKRAVRVDILERLADIIRPLIAFDPEKSSEPAPEGAAPGNG
ncbi:MAG TPA: helicase, partial [Devosia sp.]|nr:helicase [Devosia sp.]